MGWIGAAHTALSLFWVGTILHNVMYHDNGETFEFDDTDIAMEHGTLSKGYHRIVTTNRGPTWCNMERRCPAYSAITTFK